MIEKFKTKYHTYININRFSIPIIGPISSGKSTFYNYFLGLNGCLETKEKITTKTICIIRHNKNNIKPKIYKIKDCNERHFYKYNFEKGDEIKGIPSEIIANKNKKIREKQSNVWEDYFYILEIKIPLFEGKFEKYADLFEFMDIPGLNETANDKNSINNNFYFQQIIPIIQSNIKFAIFLFDIENYMGKDTTNIILNFKKTADLNFIIIEDEEELGRKINEENELKEIKKKLDEKKTKLKLKMKQEK